MPPRPLARRRRSPSTGCYATRFVALAHPPRTGAPLLRRRRPNHPLLSLASGPSLRVHPAVVPTMDADDRAPPHGRPQIMGHTRQAQALPRKPPDPWHHVSSPARAHHLAQGHVRSAQTASHAGHCARTSDLGGLRPRRASAIGPRAPRSHPLL